MNNTVGKELTGIEHFCFLFFIGGNLNKFESQLHSKFSVETILAHTAHIPGSVSVTRTE
jgi:hypothetical protein